MTTTESTPGPDPYQTGNERLPWPILLVLAAATMTMVTGEMLPTAVLPQMSAGLGTTEASTGLLVSVWAAVVVVLSFPLVRLARRWERRAVIVGSLMVFGLSAAVTALASSYIVALLARSLGAAAVGLLWATINAYVADLVPDRLLGLATAVVLGGATFGMVLGTPVGRLGADLAGWQAPFWALAVASVLTAWTVHTVAPSAATTAEDGVGVRPSATTRLRPMLTVTVLVTLVLVGHYGAYTYITRLTEGPATLLPGGMAALLLGFGFASAVGVLLTARVGERTTVALVVSAAATAVAVLGLGLADTWAVPGVVVVLAWGVASGALPPLAQTQILRLAGPQRRLLAGALIPVLFNGGIAVGAALASAIVARDGADALPLPAAALVAVAAMGLATAGRC